MYEEVAKVKQVFVLVYLAGGMNFQIPGGLLKPIGSVAYLELFWSYMCLVGVYPLSLQMVVKFLPVPRRHFSMLPVMVFTAVMNNSLAAV